MKYTLASVLDRQIKIFNNNNNNNYITTTPLKGLFSVMLKSPSLLVKNPNWKEANQLAIYKA